MLHSTLGVLVLAVALPFPPGSVIEQVTSGSDPSQSYALYLPSAYTPERRWPILVLMDPRGRALVPLEIFREAAERRGWILASSYGTRSDGPAESNVTAMNALLPDVGRRFAVDPRRLYLAGFSGTARAAFEFAGQLGERVAGVIAFGGGLPQGFELTRAPGFIYFGSAGATDFNYEEMRALDWKLAKLGAPHRFRSFDGPHAWGPPEIASEAIDWMEVRAMRAGVRDKESAPVEEIFSRWMGQAGALAAAGEDHEAAMRYGAIAEDLAGLRDVAEASAKARELARTRSARRTESLLARQAARQRSFETRFSSFIGRFSAASPPPPLERSLEDLQIAAMKSLAGGERGPMEALAARRLLQLVLVHTSYYLPHDFMERRDPGRALAILKVAAAVEPDDPDVHLGMARARAQIGQRAQAIEDLRRLAAVAPRIDAAFLENDAWLEPLREEPGFREILETLRSRAPAGP